jgi:FlaA1/EpsC-like NDP-sugar epimerase
VLHGGPSENYDTEVRPWISLTDVASVVTATLAAHALRFGVAPDLRLLTTMALILVPVTVAVFAALGLYAPARSALSELLRTVLGTATVLTSLVVATFWTDTYVSRSWLAMTFILAVPLVATSRVAWRMTRV